MQEVAKEFRELDENFINFSDSNAPLIFKANAMLVQHSFELPIRVTLPGKT